MLNPVDKHQVDPKARRRHTVRPVIVVPSFLCSFADAVLERATDSETGTSANVAVPPKPRGPTATAWTRGDIKDTKKALETMAAERDDSSRSRYEASLMRPGKDTRR